ncbi:hypothetical protein [Hyalangium versicolor]|uniref:hypothetical protein n=1 Tax=Hyalangium versicolor TaxID=2861190 RepID=UPI001CCFE77F|nr:hypothetical protein [Hyalangium versicolor]
MAEETQKKPFAFELVYEIPGEETLRNVLLTEDRLLELRATNILIRDDEAIILNPVTSVAPDKFHFLLQLRTGLLAPGTITSPGSDWKVLRQENAELRTTDIYLGWSGAARRLEAGETLPIPLKGLFSASEARPSLPMLLSWPEPETEVSTTALLGIEPRFPGQPGEYETEAYLILRKVLWGGRTRVPLRLDAVGPYQVLNVDNQPSTLVLRLGHSAPPGSQEEDVVFNYSSSQPTQSSSLQLEVPVGSVANSPLALATADQANGINLAMTGFTAARGVASPDGTRVTFKLTPTATKTLKPGEFLDLTLTNVVTGHPSGRVEVDLTWAQVQGFRDGKLSYLLEKAPLIFGREHPESIGIGGGTKADARVTLKTDSSDYSGYGLQHTNGTATLGTKVSTHSLYPNKSGGWMGTATNHSLHFFTNNGDPQVTLDTDGHFGIGTLTPAAPLDVKGNAYIHDGSLGIGTTSPAAPLDVRGNAAIQNGRLGVGTSSPAAPLDVRGNAIIQNGKLGIGTTDPKAPLDVHGSIFINGVKPFDIKKFSASGPSVATNYSSDIWVPWVMSLQTNSNPSNSSSNELVWSFTKTNNHWVLTCLVDGVGAKSISVTILFMRRELVNDLT